MATIVTSIRRAFPPRYRAECSQCHKVYRWSSFKDSALADRDDHNGRYHNERNQSTRMIDNS